MSKLVTTLADAKARMSLAREAARKADPLSAALFDRWYATALSSAVGQPDEIAAVMFVRTAICLEVLTEMKGWPAGKVAGVRA
jgi:hypothetical protein